MKLDPMHGWEQIRRHLPPDYRALADAHKQVETQYGNAKIRDADTLLRFLLLHIGANLPLRQTVALMAEAGMPSLSPMRLHKKMARAAPYLQELVMRLVGRVSDWEPERWGGYTFTAVDASVVCGPGAVGADARVHLKLRLPDVAIASVEITDEHGGESFVRFTWLPGELAVADRAYCTARGVHHVVRSGADVLVRYRLGTLPIVDDAGDPVNALDCARALADGEIFDMDISVPVPAERVCLPARLIAMRLPPDAARRARDRVRKSEGASVSAQTLESAGYVILLTTAPRSRLDGERCLLAYRVRWQVELQFKRWKSLCRLDCLPNQRDDTTLAWLYGKILIGVLLDRMASIPTELSPPAPNAKLGDASDVVRPVESHEHPAPAVRRRSAATRAA